MMRLSAFYILFIVNVQCYPQTQRDEILHQEFSPLHDAGNGVQTYSYSYTTLNGIHHDENGVIGPNTNGMVVKGAYSYTRPDGRPQTVNYIADFNGFRIINGGIPQIAIISIAG